MFKKITIVLCGMMLSINAFGQLELTKTPVSDTLRPDLTKYIPPLYMLIDSAVANDPETKRWELESEVFEHQIKVQKKMWIRDIGIGGTYTPLVNYLPQWTVEGDGSPVFDPVNFSNGFGFTSSVYGKVELSLDQLFFKNPETIKGLEAQAQADAQGAVVASRLIAARVTELYNNLFMYQRMLEINQKAIQMGKMGVELGEEKFRNGQIQLSELSQLYDLMTKYGLDYERSYSAYRSAYIELERVVGVPLSKFKY